MSPTSARQEHGFFASIRDALAGAPGRDFTEGSLNRAITLLAIPMVLEMMMESLFAVVDVFWVAHLGSDAVAAVGLTESLITVLYSVALGLSIATTATVARRIGEKNPQGAGETAAQSILLGLAIGVALGSAGCFFAPQLLRMMGAPPGVLATGTGYARAIYGGSGTVALLFLINAVFRGAGDAALAMRVLWIANGINILLNPCLIFGLGPFPRLGVAGSGVGTTIGRGCGVLLQLWLLTRGRSRVVLHLRDIRLRPELMWRLVKLAVGGATQYLTGAASWIALVRMTASFGSAALAGYTLALRIILFALLPGWGLASAAATMVGQNLGAKKPERAEQSVWRTGLFNMSFMGLVTVVLLLFARPLVEIFTRESDVVSVASSTLHVVAYGYVFYAWGMVLVQAFNGAGDTVTPNVLYLICFWAWQLPLAWFLAFQSAWGPVGIFAAIAIAQSTLAVTALAMFRRGKWKTQRV